MASKSWHNACSPVRATRKRVRRNCGGCGEIAARVLIRHQVRFTPSPPVCLRNHLNRLLPISYILASSMGTESPVQLPRPG